jgi:hypothetical protein
MFKTKLSAQLAQVLSFKHYLQFVKQQSVSLGPKQKLSLHLLEQALQDESVVSK